MTVIRDRAKNGDGKEAEIERKRQREREIDRADGRHCVVIVALVQKCPTTPCRASYGRGIQVNEV